MVLARLFSNSSPPTLLRALVAHRELDIADVAPKSEKRPRAKRALRLTRRQQFELASQYGCGMTTYELAASFGVDRRTVSNHLRHLGVTIRRRPPTVEDVRKMATMYSEGQSASNIGLELGICADTVLAHLKKEGVRVRGPHERFDVRS